MRRWLTRRQPTMTPTATAPGPASRSVGRRAAPREPSHHGGDDEAGRDIRLRLAYCPGTNGTPGAARGMGAARFRRSSRGRPRGATGGSRDLAETATVIVQARCIGQEPRLKNGRIFTYVRLQVLEIVKGAPPAELEVRVLGGVVPVPGRSDGLRLAAFVPDGPRLRENADSVAHCRPLPCPPASRCAARLACPPTPRYRAAHRPRVPAQGGRPGDEPSARSQGRGVFHG